MSHARIEEVSDSDSDPDIMDPTALSFDPSHPASADHSADFAAAAAAAAAADRSALMDPSSIPASSSSAAAARASSSSSVQPPPTPPDAKDWLTVYPVYFDAAKTRAGGRRVGKEHATRNPMALAIREAIGRMGWDALLEPGKNHPKDWSNPGRVKVNLKKKSRQGFEAKNKHHLYILIADYLKAHPTTEMDPLKLPVQGLPVPKDGAAPPPPAVPRGWKMNSVLPLHSAASSGGGVSDDLLRDMMAEMGGQDPAPAIKEKKEKKGKGKKK